MLERAAGSIVAARLLSLIAPALAWLVACAPGEEAGVTQPTDLAATSALTLGPLPSAVGLMNATGTLFCSGSLLSPRLVLTAGHCLVHNGVIRWPYAVFIGADARRGGTFLRVQGGAVHAQYDAFLHTADLALLRLADDEATVEPLEVATTSPAPGDEVHFAGFGESDDGPAHYQHAGRAAVTFVAADYFRYTPGTCRGDSGGPVLATAPGKQRQVGVVSMTDLSCSNARAVDLARYAPWVADTAAALDPPDCRGGDRRCGNECPFGDTDCPCMEDGQCGLCAGIDPDCAPDCAADGFCMQSCLAPDPDCHAGIEGARCSADVECASSLCLDGRCRSRCGGVQDASCPPWQSCTLVAPGQAVCLDPRPVAGACSVSDRAPAPAAPAVLALGLLALCRRALAAARLACRSRTPTAKGESR